jgi:hypothetical protein
LIENLFLTKIISGSFFSSSFTVLASLLDFIDSDTCERKFVDVSSKTLPDLGSPSRLRSLLSPPMSLASKS